MGILASRGAGREDADARDRIVAELCGAGDQRHRRDGEFQLAHHPAELDRDIGNAVAERGQVQPLEHQVAESAIGRRVASPLLGLDEAIGQLVGRTAIEAKVQRLGPEQLAIGPYAAEPAHLALAQGDGEVGEDGGRG
jgi:hypothetical protein